ncbi:hypothetical protein BZG36_04122 [Bifiguratus adelaidae]|uniref:N-acetylglucosamine-6-phosphate deacetylase n=1 Tax=Bifiguratus adelaidae TaxID=1938954 RepID=A0A261XX76_9FUNG|nr:hypothetical protein BZG36_04122 [Bifiguratus adelaidae]
MSRPRVTKIINCRVLLDHKIVHNAYLWFQDGIIIDPQQHFYDARFEPDEVIDAHGRLVVPGFIDAQINGAFGVDFTTDAQPEVSDETLRENLAKVSKGLLKFGCTAYCPTVVSAEPEIYHRVLPMLRPQPGSVHGAAILGAHIEGPFISHGKRGAHRPHVLSAAPNGIEDLYERYGEELKERSKTQEGQERAVKIITVAPELEGILDVIPELVDKGVIVSIGHSEAKIADAEAGVAQGATFITHLFNAMLAFHHRDPGIIGTLGSTHLPIPSKGQGHPSPSATSPDATQPDPRPFYGLICDGIHAHPNSIKVAYYSHPKGCVLVTDALSAAGLPPGTYPLAGREISVDDSLHAYIKDTTTLAGSVITMDACIRNFVAFTKCTLVEAIEAATLHPAQLLGIVDRKGSLNVGRDADLVFIDDSNGPDQFVVERVFVGGEEVVF